MTLTIPDKIDLDAKETTRFLAAKLYEVGKLTLGQAAEMTGFSKSAFAEMLADYGVSIINYPISDIKSDAAKL